MSTFGQPIAELTSGTAPVAVPRTAPWLAASAGAVLLVVAGGWFTVVSPQRTATSDLRASTAQVEANEQALGARVTELEQEFAALPEHQAELASLQRQMPEDAALPELVRGVRDVAARAGVTLTSLTPSTPVVASAAASTTPQPADPAQAAGGSPAAPGAVDPATGAPAASADGAAGSGLLQVPVTLTATGSYSALMTFLSGLQQEDRLLLVTGTTVSPGTQSAEQGALLLSVTGSVFSLPAASTGTAPGPSAAPATAVAPAPAGTTALN